MDVRGKKVTLVGMGRTSVSLVKLLLREGAAPLVTEARNTPAIEVCEKEVDALGVPHECGGHSAEAFRDASVIVPSPGVPPSLEPIKRAREALASGNAGSAKTAVQEAESAIRKAVSKGVFHAKTGSR